MEPLRRSSLHALVVSFVHDTSYKYLFPVRGWCCLGSGVFLTDSPNKSFPNAQSWMLTGTERALQPRIRQVQRSQGRVESAAAKEAPGGGFTTEQDLTREGVRQWGGLDFLPRAGGGQCAWGVSGPALPPGTCFQEREELLLPTAVCLSRPQAWKEGQRGEGPEAQGQRGQNQPDAHPVKLPRLAAGNKQWPECQVRTAGHGPQSSVGPSPAVGGSSLPRAGRGSLGVPFLIGAQ